MIIFSQIIANHYKLLSKVAARVAICGEEVEVESVLTSGEADNKRMTGQAIVFTWGLMGSSGEIWVGNALTSQPPPHGPHQNPRTP